MNVSYLLDIGDTIANAIIGPIGMVLWGLCDIFFLIVNLFESVFRKLAGVDIVYTNNGEAIEGDIVLYLINTDIVQDIFFSITILGFFLLIVFSIFAIVKNQYADKPKPVSGIISNGFKGLLMYLLVPVATVVCLAVGNLMLQAIDGATRTQTSGSASDMLFIASAYNANIVRYSASNGDEKALKDNLRDLKELYEDGYLDGIKDELSQLGINQASDINFIDGNTLENVADLIDSAFVEGRLDGVKIDMLAASYGNKWNYYSISRYYNCMKISYITVWIGGGFLIWILGKICWGLLGRLFKMVVTYCMTPAFMGMYPLDEGKALKSWAVDFSKNATMAYVSVAVMNLMMSVLPFIKNIEFFGGGGAGPIDLMVQLMITISAYAGASGIIATVSGWVGTGDAFAAGKSTKDTVMKPLKTGASKALGTFHGIRGGVKATGEHSTRKEKFWGGVMGAYAGSGLSEKFNILGAGEEAQKREKAAKEMYDKLHTTNLFTGGTSSGAGAFKTRQIMEKEEKQFQESLDKFITDPNDATAIKSLNKTSVAQALTEKDRAKLQPKQEMVETYRNQMLALSGVSEAMEAREDLLKSIFGEDNFNANYEFAKKDEFYNMRKSDGSAFAPATLSKMITDFEKASKEIFQAEQAVSAQIGKLSDVVQSDAKVGTYLRESVLKDDKYFTKDVYGNIKDIDANVFKKLDEVANIVSQTDTEAKRLNAQTRKLKADLDAIDLKGAQSVVKASQDNLTPDDMDIVRKWLDKNSGSK